MGNLSTYLRGKRTSNEKRKRGLRAPRADKSRRLLGKKQHTLKRSDEDGLRKILVITHVSRG